MSSRAMASAKNKRTSPFIMGNKTMVPPQPINKTLSGGQRVSQIQGRQTTRNIPRSSGPPAPVQTRQENLAVEPSSNREYGRSSSYGRRELSIPEAFAMLNKKISMMEEILEDKGIEFENHTMVDNKSNVDEKIKILRRDMEDVIRDSSPNLNSIFMQIKLIKEEKDNEIALLNNTIHELSEELREFKNRFEHEEGSTAALGDDENATLITYNDSSNDSDTSLTARSKSDTENITMQINEDGEIESNNNEEEESRESEEEVAEEVVEDVVEEVVDYAVEEIISAS